MQSLTVPARSRVVLNYAYCDWLKLEQLALRGTSLRTVFSETSYRTTANSAPTRSSAIDPHRSMFTHSLSLRPITYVESNEQALIVEGSVFS